MPDSAPPTPLPPPALDGAGLGARARVRWHSLPLRTRLAAVTTSLLFTGLLVTGASSVLLLHRHLVAEVDRQLAASAVALAASAIDSLAGAEAQAPLPSRYYVRYSPFGGQSIEFIQWDTRRASGEPALPDLTIDEVLDVGDEPFTARSTRLGHAWRVAVYPVVDGQTITGIVAVALPLDEASSTVAQLVRVLLASGAVIVAIGGIAGSMAVRRALRPLRDVEATAQAFAAGDLARRVPAEPPSTEVGRLAVALNGMLAQIEAAFAARAASEARMRRFVADASHELRTPLATVRGYGELYRMGAIAPDDVGAAMGRIEGEAIRMGTLVADLLHLAKLDEGRPLARDPVDLRALASDAAVDLRALDPTRVVRVVGLHESPPDGGGRAPSSSSGENADDGAPRGPDDPVRACGDENRLRQVLANLIGNVAQHTPPGSAVEIAVGRGARSTAGGAVVALEVRDHGPGIRPEDAERVFERFYRPDTSRARSSGGSGLGLAIVAAIVGAHHGTVRALETAGGGTTIRVEVPAAPDDAVVCHDGMPDEADQG